MSEAYVGVTSAPSVRPSSVRNDDEHDEPKERRRPGKGIKADVAVSQGQKQSWRDTPAQSEKARLVIAMNETFVDVRK